jgi:hypothetical protein
MESRGRGVLDPPHARGMTAVCVSKDCFAEPVIGRRGNMTPSQRLATNVCDSKWVVIP